MTFFRSVRSTIQRLQGAADCRYWSLRQIMGSVTLFCVSFAILSFLWRFSARVRPMNIPTLGTALIAFWAVFWTAILNLFRRSVVCWGIASMMWLVTILGLMTIAARRIGME